MQAEDISDSPTILALIAGEPYTELPTDLFIPPDALSVLLESFSGPLDLLCYLIRKQNLDIMDIPIALITKQYMEYIELLEAQRLELAAEYLVMAAMLAEIKSRLLLPRNVSEEGDEEEDPRLVLVRKLQAYEEMKIAAYQLDELPRLEREFFSVQMLANGLAKVKIHPDVDLDCLPALMCEIYSRQGLREKHQISREPLSVRERMTMVLQFIQQEKILNLRQLYTKEEGRMGLAVSLLAILELARQSLIKITQIEPFSPIYVMAIDHAE